MNPLDPNRTFPARNNGAQGVQCMRAKINFNDGGIASAIQIGTIPQNAFILDYDEYIETGFNAGTTNVLTLGTTQANANELVSSADLNEGATGDTAVVRGRGMALTAAGDVGIWAKYTQTGTAATAGIAHICLTWAPPNG